MGLGKAVAIAATAMSIMAQSANAALVSNVGGSLHYTATPGEVNRLVLERQGTAVIVRDSGAGVLLGIPGCPRTAPATVRCEGVVDAAVSLADGDDVIAVLGELEVSVDAGSGDDVLAGGSASDVMDGGEGRDTADYSARVAGVVVTLDGVRNDGTPGERDQAVRVEIVIGGSGNDVIDADDGPNEVYGGPGDDSLNGGGEGDKIDGGAGQDGVNALDPGADGDAPGGDGSGDVPPDTVSCGSGRDRVYGDEADGYGSDCERVSRGAVAGVAVGSRVSPAAPAPVLGKSVLLEPVSGVVLVTAPEPGSPPRTRQDVPAGPAFPLDGETNVPVGSVVDTRFGTVAMTVAVDRESGTDSGQFHSGPFQVFQDDVVGAVADLELRGGKSFNACPAGQMGPGTATTAARRRGARPVRRLWSSAKGRFRTRGRFAAATVRGTRWLTEDRCEGTLVRVREGAVAVADLRTGTDRLVPAGQSYLVRAGRR